MIFDQADKYNISTTSVGEIVANNYKSAEIFSKYGIDF